MNKKLALITIIILLLAQWIPAQTAHAETELRNIMRIEFDAFRLHDPATYSGVVADDAIYVGSGRKGFKTKADIVEEIKKAPAFFASASLSLTDVQVRVYKDTAVMVCLATFRFKNEEGKDMSLQFQMSRVHVRRKGRWRLVAHHGSSVQ